MRRVSGILTVCSGFGGSKQPPLHQPDDHFGLAARIITKTASRTAVGISGQLSMSSRSLGSSASDFAAPLSESRRFAGVLAPCSTPCGNRAALSLHQQMAVPRAAVIARKKESCYEEGSFRGHGESDSYPRSAD